MRYAGLMVLALAGSALGQCPRWLPGYAYEQSPLNGNVPAMAVWHPHSGPDLLAVSSNFPVSGIAPVKVALWDGEAWMPLPEGPRISPRALASLEGDLVVGGFKSGGPLHAMSHIAAWTGQAWEPLGGGLNSPVRALLVHDGALYAGGEFTSAGGVPVKGLARWDGAAWHDVGGGVMGGFVPMVLSLASHNGDLYVGGFFSAVGGMPTHHLARWDGEQWHTIPQGGPASVEALASFQGGLIVGGHNTGGAPALARWDGAAWHAIGGGVDQTVRALVVKDGDLYVGGFFAAAGGSGASRIARWDGSAWHALGSGITSTAWPSAYVESLASYRGEVIAGGFFDTAGGLPSVNFARWGCPDGSCYANCDQSTQAPVLNIADFTCFLGRFAAGEPYANCDESTTEPVLNVADFACFLTKFAGGCR